MPAAENAKSDLSTANSGGAVPLRETVELEALTTRFNTLAVRQSGERIDLEVEGATFATWHPRLAMTGFSWDALAVAALLRGAGPPRSILLLGLGGGTVTRQLRMLLPDVRLVGVEIDAGIVDLARRYMHLDEQGVEVHVEDAYDYLARTKDKFDAILDDLFLTGPTDVVRTRVPDGDTLGLLRKRLTPGGVLVANLITDDGDHRTVRLASRRAFLGAFPSVRVVVPPRGLNEILVGGEETRPRSVLDAYVGRFAEAHDQRRLKEILVKPLRRRG